MPNLGPGVDQVVNPAVTPTWIFTPTKGLPNTVRLFNTGTNAVYVGPSGVDIPAGLAILPGNRPIELQNVQQTLYAVSGVVGGAAAGTMTSSAATAGSTALTLTAAVPAGLAAGTTIIVGSTAGTGWESQVVASTTASSQITFANPLVNDHVGSTVIFSATAQIGQLRVTAGVV